MNLKFDIIMVINQKEEHMTSIEIIQLFSILAVSLLGFFNLILSIQIKTKDKKLSVITMSRSERLMVIRRIFSNLMTLSDYQYLKLIQKKDVLKLETSGRYAKYGDVDNEGNSWEAIYKKIKSKAVLSDYEDK